MQISGHSPAPLLSPQVNAQVRSHGPPQSPAGTDDADTQQADPRNTPNTAAAGRELSQEQRQQLRQLQQRDREVRAHEAAHQGAAGSLSKGGASFSYARGPDGRHYAVGGEVSIDTSAVAGDPQATLRKAQQIRAAALAPAQPSGQDRAVAAAATVMAAEARSEIAQQHQESSEPAAASQPSEPGKTGADGDASKQVRHYQQVAADGDEHRDRPALSLMV